jgi:hypothetical protein
MENRNVPPFLQRDPPPRPLPRPSLRTSGEGMAAAANTEYVAACAGAGAPTAAADITRVIPPCPAANHAITNASHDCTNAPPSAPMLLRAHFPGLPVVDAPTIVDPHPHTAQMPEPLSLTMNRRSDSMRPFQRSGIRLSSFETSSHCSTVICNCYTPI